MHLWEGSTSGVEGPRGTPAALQRRGARSDRAALRPLSRPGWLLLLVIALSAAVPRAMAAAPARAAEAARWLAADTVVYLEIPRPDGLIDRLLDERIQDYLKLVPAYREYLDGRNYGQLRAVAEVIANRLDTTWKRGLRDLTGGGVVAAVEA